MANAPKTAQPGTISYGSSSGVTAYAHRGALVISGGGNYRDAAFSQSAAGGATVLLYINPIIRGSRYHYGDLLVGSSACGGAVGDWPGKGSSEYGAVLDFRPGGTLQRKLDCVLETMANENRWAAGFFLDDLGTKNWFSGVNWGSWSASDRAAYRQGAIDIAATARRVADRHGMIWLANGTWNAGLDAGGGYPNANAHGNALADGVVIEHHDDADAFWRNYVCSSQWAAQTSRSSRPVNLAITYSQSAIQTWSSTGCVTHGAVQSGYGITPAPWGSFFDLGMPSGN